MIEGVIIRRDGTKLKNRKENVMERLCQGDGLGRRPCSELARVMGGHPSFGGARPDPMLSLQGMGSASPFATHKQAMPGRRGCFHANSHPSCSPVQSAPSSTWLGVHTCGYAAGGGRQLSRT